MASVDRPFASSFPPGRSAAVRGGFPASEATGLGPVAAPRDRLRDLTALALLAACVFLAGALATYHPADPPAARGFPANARAVNACGFIGAAAAGGLYEWLGLGAWFVLALVVAHDVTLLRRRPLPDLPLRALGAVLATGGLCTLLAMFLPTWVWRPVWGPGGGVGAIGSHLCERYLATTGAAIVAAGLTAAGLFLACDAILVAVGAAGLAAAAAVGNAAGTVWQTIGNSLRRGGESGSDALEAAPPQGRCGLGVRGASAADDAEDDAADSVLDDESGPTIKVRRRAVETAEAESDSSFDDDAETFEVDADATDAGDGSSADDESVDPPVPIRSRGSRRKPASVLELAPDPTADYELPSIDLLLPAEQLQLEAQEQEVRERAKVLEKTFADFGFKVRVVEIETGPVISQYEIELEAGLRLAKIANLADDLAIALRVPSVRIVAPIPGKNSVGIEVPNTDRQMVRLREVIEETQAKSRTMKIPIFLGKDVAGNPMVVDMAAMPHLLIAGRTGTGKSVCLNSLIVSMLMTRRPDEVRMLMIDPKMVELTPYKSLPHLMHPVVTDMKKAEAILAWAVDKMEERYAMLAKVGVRHLSQYNALGRDTILERMSPESDEEAATIPTTMPYIVMIADEIADMMMTAGKEIEQHIIRLAQKSRAVGIHLVLATQKPTVDVITGLIKSNLPARIAFQVASRTDSRVVLDEMGAERLLGNGDMLFLSPGTSQILRGQGTYLSDDEIGRVMAAVGTDKPQYAEELVNLKPAPSGDAPKGPSPKDKDELYEAAVEVVIREGRGSVSLLQRALGVGYGRGARLIDFMAEDGVVGQYAGSQAREVLLTLEQWAERNGTEPVPADPAPRGKLKIKPHAAQAAAAVVEEDEDEADREEAFADGLDDDDIEDDEAEADDGDEYEDGEAEDAADE